MSMVWIRFKWILILIFTWKVFLKLEHLVYMLIELYNLNGNIWVINYSINNCKVMMKMKERLQEDKGPIGLGGPIARARVRKNKGDFTWKKKSTPISLGLKWERIAQDAFDSSQ